MSIKGLCTRPLAQVSARIGVLFYSMATTNLPFSYVISRDFQRRIAERFKWVFALLLFCMGILAVANGSSMATIVSLFVAGPVVFFIAGVFIVRAFSNIQPCTVTFRESEIRVAAAKGEARYDVQTMRTFTFIPFASMGGVLNLLAGEEVDSKALCQVPYRAEDKQRIEDILRDTYHLKRATEFRKYSPTYRRGNPIARIVIVWTLSLIVLLFIVLYTRDSGWVTSIGWRPCADKPYKYCIKI
jgi:hypothetical protein